MYYLASDFWPNGNDRGFTTLEQKISITLICSLKKT